MVHAARVRCCFRFAGLLVGVLPKRGSNAPMINVILCTDGKYVQHLGVTLVSLLSNNPDNQFVITVVTGKRKQSWESRLAQMAAHYGNASIQFKTFDLRRVTHLRTDHHLSVAIYARLFLTEFFDDSVSKALYLDSDLIVCRDISPLWNTDISGHALAAVRDHPAARSGLDPPIPAERYFNSGVLLVNLDRWRCSGAPHHLIQFAEEHGSKLLSHDQDVLNGVYSSETYLLGLEWNFQARYAEYTAEELWMEPEDFIGARDNPSVIHFSTKHKPWNYGAKVPHQELYFQYLALTPWRGYIPRETLQTKLRRILRFDEMKQQIKSRFPQTARLLRRARSRNRVSPPGRRAGQSATPLDV
jgi:lipopolysaccharide biosynthesis glycosyltransferase